MKLKGFCRPRRFSILAHEFARRYFKEGVFRDD